MNKMLIFLAFFILIVFISCDGKAPGCTTLSWTESESSNYFEPTVMYTAGTMCSNISDYFNVTSDDIKESANTLKKMLLSTDLKCYDGENGDIEVECPEYVPETIEFGDIIGCKFETPPSSRDDCAPGGSLTVVISTSVDYFPKVGFSFFPPENIKETDIPSNFGFNREDDTSMVGEFFDNFSKASVEFSEIEFTDTGREKTTVIAIYSVEINN